MEFDLEDPLSALYPATTPETGAEVAAPDDEEGEAGYGRVLPKRSRRHRPASVAALFTAEAEQHVSTERLDARLRHDAVSIVIHARESSYLDPLVAYLAINYVDRFLSQRELPSGKPWIVRLLAIACLSLAAKMNKVDVCVADLQRHHRFIHDSRTIRRMELLVLGALNWRMRSVTPFSFLELFLTYFPHGEDHAGCDSAGLHLATLKARATQIVCQSQVDIKFLEYRPSEMAVSALVLAADELFPAMSPSFHAAVSACPFVNNATLGECLQSMGATTSSTLSSGLPGALHNDNCVTGRLYGNFPAFSSSCDTPVTVLIGHHQRHYPSSESERTLSSPAAGEPGGVGGVKKARISGFIRCSTAAGCPSGHA